MSADPQGIDLHITRRALCAAVTYSSGSDTPSGRNGNIDAAALAHANALQVNQPSAASKPAKITADEHNAAEEHNRLESVIEVLRAQRDEKRHKVVALSEQIVDLRFELAEAKRVRNERAETNHDHYFASEIDLPDGVSISCQVSLTSEHTYPDVLELAEIAQIGASAAARSAMSSAAHRDAASHAAMLDAIRRPHDGDA